MNDKEQKQLLSAYFDNEVTPEERKQIEQLLESSDDARRVLEETGQLADLIRMLPKQTAPETLSAAVMQQTEQQRLAAVPSTKNGSTSRGRSWLKWTAGLITTAVVLFVATHFILKPKPVLFENNAETSLEGSDEVAFNEDGEIDIDDFFGAESGGDPDMTEMIAGTDLPDTGNANMKTRVALVTKSPAEGGHNRVDRMTVPLPENGTGAENGTAGGSGQARMSVASNKIDAHRRAHFGRTNFRDVDWKTVQVGEMFDYNEFSNGEVTIVEVTVVDVQKAMGEMQMLLARNSIPDVTLKELNKKSKTEQKEGKDEQEATDKQQRKRLAYQSALFVETSQVQLTETLTALQQHDLFLNVQPTVNQVASIDFTNQFASLNTNGLYANGGLYRGTKTTEAQKKMESNFNGKGEEATQELSKPASALADAKNADMKETVKAGEEAPGIATSGIHSKMKKGTHKQVAKVGGKPKRSLKKSYQMIVAVDHSASKSSLSPAFSAPQAMSTESHPGNNNSAKNRKGEGKKNWVQRGSGKDVTKKSSGKSNNLSQKEKTFSSKEKQMLDGNKNKRSQVAKGAFKSSVPLKPVRVLFIFSKRDAPVKKAAVKPKQK